jgi:hypothetical protein
MFAVV